MRTAAGWADARVQGSTLSALLERLLARDLLADYGRTCLRGALATVPAPCKLDRPGKRPSTMSMEKQGPNRSKRDFFISYTKVDREWAEWIGWQIEAVGWSVLVPDWETPPGSNWMNMMADGVEAARTIVVLSPAYLVSPFCRLERFAVLADDPLGLERKLIAVRIAQCEPPDFLKTLVSIDLAGLGREDEARDRLLSGIRQAVRGHSRPLQAPSLPVSLPPKPKFPPLASAAGGFVGGLAAGAAAAAIVAGSSTGGVGEDHLQAFAHEGLDSLGGDHPLDALGAHVQPGFMESSADEHEASPAGWDEGDDGEVGDGAS